MKKILKRGLSLVLTLVMLVGLLPVTAFAKVNNDTGMPLDVDDTLVLSIYTGNGIPGEPVVHGTTGYRNINSNFKAASGDFASTAKSHLNEDMVLNDIREGVPGDNTYVWGIYNSTGLKAYFNQNSTILEKETEIIKAIKNCSEEEAKKYEIVWYVIKLQHTPGWWIFGGTTEWHIDGIIKEKDLASVNYYGNGNTAGDPPVGITNHDPSKSYTVLGNTSTYQLKKVVNNVELAFLGWNTKADGTGKTYQAGDSITPEEFKESDNKISLYAMWDSYVQHTATVNTYLDGVKTDESVIHGSDRQLALGDGSKYYDLNRDSTGVYTAEISGNGTFNLYNKNEDGTYDKIGTRQLTIYNQNGSMDVNHYSVTYDANGGSFATEPGKQVYYYGDTVTAIAEQPTKAGYRFLGWNTKVDGTGTMIQSGKAVTGSITAPITLYAQWEETVDITINVTIDHKGGDGYDQVVSKDNVSLALVSRVDEDSPYLEVKDKTLDLSKPDDSKDQTKTEYTGLTFEDMPGGDVDYTVVTSKSGYDTKITSTQDANGNWTINVEMTYQPSNFDVEFTVQMDTSVPEEYRPKAAIVKVTFWSNKDNEWQIITQQEDNLPGVRVNLNENGSGSGKYPVWKYESGTTDPYGYRIEITSFVYPDDTIVRASEVTDEVEWSDNVYTATMQEVTGGKNFGTLKGAYYNETQVGTLHIEVKRNKYDVTFDANGGEIEGEESLKLEDQYVIPALDQYVPTREGDFLFAGWYEDEKCTVPATAGKTLSANVSLYAKWIELRTIKGEILICGTYPLNGTDVTVNAIDKATEAIVVLEEKRNENYYEVNSQRVTLTYEEGKDDGKGSYGFSGILDDGKEYRIQLLLLNYTTEYKNEDNTDGKYHADKEFTAVFGDDNEAEVNAKLTFVPPSYDQWMAVDATAIGDKFRPEDVLAKVLYRDTGDNHPFKIISQHRDDPQLGVSIKLQEGTGRGSESVWKWHTNGALYDYQMQIVTVDGNAYDSDTAPFYIQYGQPARWNNNNARAVSTDMTATLIPKQYPVTFDLNAGTDTVTGMDNFKLSYEDEEGNTVVTDNYGIIHTWSKDTVITAVPQREGYKFLGWTTEVEKVTSDDKGNITIPADVQEEVVLKAVWEGKRHVKVSAVTGGTASGTGYYISGETATVTATANDKYIFTGWYENGELVSTDASYSFVVTTDRILKAEFAEYRTITTTAEGNGTVSGGGQYAAQTEVTITATPDAGYNFIGWYKDGNWVTSNLTHTFTVWKDETFVAKFNKEVSYDCDYVYLFGYTDSEIGAEGPLLRGELAQMIYRLVKQKNGAAHTLVTFKDTAGEWFQWGMSY